MSTMPMHFGACLLIAMTTTAYGDSVLFVDAGAPPGGDGSTWSTAHRYLQDALGRAGADPSITEIRIAQGTYTPDRDEAGHVVPGDRDTTFQLWNGLAVRGGYRGAFAGSGPPDDRAIDQFETILSGDLLGDDVEPFINAEENCLHVVTGSLVDATAELEGCTVSRGYANGPVHPERGSKGAGMLIVDGDPVIDRCTFTWNRAAYVDPFLDGGGAGMYVRYSEPVVVDCRFLDNWVGPSAGGGILNSYSKPRIQGCLFERNRAFQNSGGAAIKNHESPALIIDCRFVENVVDIPSGGSHGGAISNQSSAAWIERCVFERNRADGHGGAISSVGYGSPTIVNCLFVENEAGMTGGAMSSNHTATPRVINCTIVANSARQGGGAYRNSAEAWLTNCVIWDNHPDELVDAGHHLVVRHSNIMGGWITSNDQGNISQDPGFVDASLGDYRVLPGSPCIDSGDNTGVPDEVETDLAGLPRFVDDPRTVDTGVGPPPVVDMGAYEYQPAADFDVSSVVGAEALLAVVAAWGSPDGDVTGDGSTDIADLLAALSLWRIRE